MMIEQRQANHIETCLRAVISIMSCLRNANQNLDGIKDTIKIYIRINKLVFAVDRLLFK